MQVLCVCRRRGRQRNGKAISARLDWLVDRIGTGNWCPFAHCRRACCVTAVPPRSQISICTTPYLAYGTTPSEQASTASCPGPSYVPQVPSHDREPQSLVQLARFFFLWPQGIWRCAAKRLARILPMLFMDLQPFSPVLRRRATTNNVASSAARRRQGIPSRYMDCAVRVPRARQIETHAFPGGSLQFAARIPCAQRVRGPLSPHGPPLPRLPTEIGIAVFQEVRRAQEALVLPCGKQTRLRDRGFSRALRCCSEPGRDGEGPESQPDSMHVAGNTQAE